MNCKNCIDIMNSPLQVARTYLTGILEVATQPSRLGPTLNPIAYVEAIGRIKEMASFGVIEIDKALHGVEAIE